MSRNTDKSSIVINTKDAENMLQDFTKEEAGEIFMALLAYANRGEEFKTDDRSMRTLFRTLQANIDRNNERYEEKCERNRQIAMEREKKRKEAREKESIKTTSVNDTNKTTAITKWKNTVDKSIKDKKIQNFLKLREAANKGTVSWNVVKENLSNLSEEEQIDIRSDLEDKQVADMVLYCLTDKEVKKHASNYYNTDNVFMRLKCPECGNESTVLVDDMEDYYGDTWFDLDNVYDLDTDKACEILGICPHCTRDLDLKGVFIKALEDYKKKHIDEIEFKRNEYYMETEGIDDID